MSYVTGFFLVFAGMLIGYFLWYRDRSEDEQRRASLERENDDLRMSLKMAHQSHEGLDERFHRQRGQLNVLQQLCDDWSTNREQAERERAELELSLETQRDRSAELATELEEQKQARIVLEDQFHLLKEQNQEKISLMEKQWQANYSQVESSLQQRQTDLAAAKDECERLKKSLHHSNASLAELQAELDSQKQTMQTATANASGLKKEFISLESSLKHSNDLVKQARAECAAAQSEKQVACDALADMETKYKQLQQKCEQLQQEFDASQSLREEIETLRATMDGSRDQLTRVTEQRDEAISQQKSTLAQAAGLQKRIDNQESTIHHLRNKHRDALENLNRELQRRSELECTFEQQKLELSSRISEQQQRIEHQSAQLKSSFDEQKSKMESKLADQTGRIDQLTSQRDELVGQLRQARNDLEETQAALTEFESRTRKLVAESEDLKATCGQISELESLLASESEQLEVSRHRVSELKSLLAERDQELTAKSDELKQMSQRIAEFEELVAKRDDNIKRLADEILNLRQQYSESQQRLREIESQMSEMRSTKDQFETVRSEYQTQLDSIKLKLKASEETIRVLRRERAGVLARLANYRTVSEPNATVISFRQAMEQKARGEENYDHEYGGPTRFDKVRGLVYTSEPQHRDDLKRISGIAEVLEGRLNDYGIFTYKQIMDWKRSAIEEFSRLLAFKDRIDRDDWTGQAKRLYQQRETTAPTQAAPDQTRPRAA